MLKINGIKLTAENIKVLVLLNCSNIDVNVILGRNINSYFWFINTPIQLFDSQLDQMLIFERKSIKLFILKNQFKEIKLFKTNTGNFLFIPFDIIWRIFCSEFREILSTDDVKRQFADLGAQIQLDTNGFVIPMGYLNKIFFNSDEDELDYLNQIYKTNQIIKEIHIELKVYRLGSLLEINKLLPDFFITLILNSMTIAQ